MEIEMEPMRDEKGKKEGEKGGSQQELHDRIGKLTAQRKYQDVFKLTQELQENTQKYEIATNALLQLRKWKQLVDYCDRGLKLTEEAQFYHLKGKALGKLGNGQQAVDLISKAISLKPTVAVYHRNLGAAYYNMKQYDQVIKQHQLAISLEPDNATNYHNLGSAYFRTKQYLKAVKEFDQAILKNPKQDLSYSWKGDCFKEMGQLDLALKCYQKAYELTHSAVYLREKEEVEKMITTNKQGGAP